MKSLISIIFVMLMIVSAYSAPSSYGPYEATVVKVIDADTIKVNAYVAPGMIAAFSVRVRGIDAPEISRVCQEEKTLGQIAKLFVQEKYKVGDTIRISDVGLDKYAGRVVAHVYRKSQAGYISLSDELLESNLAVRYNGTGSHTKIWC